MNGETHDNQELLTAQNLSAGYGKETILRGINLVIRRGEFIGVAGPNGSGKTTLVRALTGVIGRREGTLRWRGRPLEDWGPKEISRSLAVVSQNPGGEIDLPVEDLVMLGRIPHFRTFQWRPSPRDRAAADRALAATETAVLREKNFRNLSGGEQQRVLIAAALAQEPDLLFLDEPTQHLDISYQIGIFRLLGELNRERGVTVFVILHDLNLASAYCHRLIYLKNGEVWKDGQPRDLISREYLSELYRARVEVLHHPETGRPLLFPGT
ncbi:MAG: ABC transporter ATP-binding protein [PVC group bacterium]